MGNGRYRSGFGTLMAAAWVGVAGCGVDAVDSSGAGGWSLSSNAWGDGSAAILSPGSAATACMKPSDCPSGFCVDAVCCNAACTGVCQACTASKKGSGADGTCGMIGAGLDPDNECPGACSGFGSCAKESILLGLGSECGTNSECASGHCVDGVCCDSSCSGTCEACIESLKGSGVDGVCGAIAANTDPENECVAANCNGFGACGAPPGSSPNGASCASGATCLSGYCADGVCCDAACTGVCLACTTTKKGGGANGVCGTIAWGTDPDNECSLTDCNGSGACGITVLKPTGSPCVAGSECASHICNNLVCESPKPTNGPLLWMTTLVATNTVGSADVVAMEVLERDNGTLFINAIEQGNLILNGYQLSAPCCWDEILGVDFSAAGAPGTVQLESCGSGLQSCYRTVVKTQGDILSRSHYQPTFSSAAPTTKIQKWPSPSWQRSFERAELAAGDTQGNSWIIGYPRSSRPDIPVDYGDGVEYYDTRLVRYSPSGNVTLNVPFNVPGGASSYIKAANGDMYGVRSRDSLGMAKINAAGVTQWAKVIPVQVANGTFEWVYMALDASDNPMVAFNFSGTVNLGIGPMTSVGTNDLAIAKFDTSGNVLWQKRFGSPGFNLQRVFMVGTGAGDIAIAGAFLGSTDLGDGPLPGSAFLAKFDTNGNLKWRVTLQNTKDLPMALSGNAAGEVFLASSSKVLDFGWGPMLAGKPGIILAKYAPM